MGDKVIRRNDGFHLYKRERYHKGDLSYAVNRIITAKDEQKGCRGKLLPKSRYESIDEAITNDGDMCLQDVIGYSDDTFDKLYLENSISKLNDEEKNIIYNRYMNDLTQSETSKIMGMSQVQVSRKEQKILQKLKYQMT